MQGTKRVARYIKPSCGVSKKIRRGSAEEPIVGFFFFLIVVRRFEKDKAISNYRDKFHRPSSQHLSNIGLNIDFAVSYRNNSRL